MESELMSRLLEKAKQTKKRIVFPEAENEIILQAARQVIELNAGRPLLVGSPAVIKSVAHLAGIPLDDFDIFDNTDEEKLNSLARRYALTPGDFTASKECGDLRHPLNCAMVLCKLGDVDCVAAGRQYSTAEVFRAARSILGMKPGAERISSLGIINVPGFRGPEGSMFALADCAVNPFPDAKCLADIALRSAETVQQLLGWQPRVAMLSFSTCGSASHESIDVILRAIEIAKMGSPELKIDGEFQLDTAILPEVAAVKMPRESDVAGRANVLVVPNLHAGNIGVKLIQIFAGAEAYGPILQGFSRPICDFSRGAPLSEMMGNIIMLLVRASIESEM